MEFFLGRCRKSPHGAAVEGTEHGDDLIAVFSQDLAAVPPGQLYGRLDGLGA